MNKDKKGKETVPVSAFSFTDSDAFAKVDAEGNVDILAYSGKPFQHWYWGNFAIDVSGALFAQKFYPVLEQHSVMAKVGFSTKPLIDNGQLSIKSMSFLNTPESLAFQENSKAGFPYQASIQGRPTILEDIAEGESVEVNGHTLKGPGTVWRKWSYMETSVCVFGADPNTKSKALSDEQEEIEVDFLKKEDLFDSEEEEVENNKSKEVTRVDLKELKEKDLAAYSALMQEARDSVKLEVKTEIETPLTAKLTELSTVVSQQSEKILSFEKTELIRKEGERKAKADSIWASKLASSDIPEHLFAKVQAHVSYVKFVSEAGFDETAFAAAIDAEIADWTKGGVSKSIIGMGFTQKEVEGQTAQFVADNVWIKDMAKLAGQTIQ